MEETEGTRGAAPRRIVARRIPEDGGWRRRGRRARDLPRRMRRRRGRRRGCGDRPRKTAAKKESGKGDVEIVNYALTLEYLEADFYNKVIDSGEITDKKIVEAAKMIAQNEQDHVDALKATAEMLGGKVAKKPVTNFDSVLAGGPGQDPRDRGNRREPRRGRVPRAGRQHHRQGDPGRRPLDPHRRGPSRGGAEPAGRQVDRPGRRVRQAGRRWPRSSSPSKPFIA